MKQLERSGIPWPVFAVDRFRIAWLVGAGAALGSAAISAFHRRPEATTGAVPVTLATADAA